MRLDKWLWHARLYKTRSLSAKVVKKGVVRVNGRRLQKPSSIIKIGDGITIYHDRRIRALKVLDISEKRGSATDAQCLYVDITSQSIDMPRKAYDRRVNKW